MLPMPVVHRDQRTSLMVTGASEIRFATSALEKDHDPFCNLTLEAHTHRGCCLNRSSDNNSTVPVLIVIFIVPKSQFRPHQDEPSVIRISLIPSWARM